MGPRAGFSALWNHFGKTASQMGRRQNGNDSTRCSRNIQCCVNISTFISLVVCRGVLKAIRVNGGDPALSRGTGRGITWPFMERAPQGPHSSAHEALQVDFHCIPCGPLASPRDSCAVLLGHPALWPAGCSMWGLLAFPMGSWGARCGPQGAP